MKTLIINASPSTEDASTSAQLLAKLQAKFSEHTTLHLYHADAFIPALDEQGLRLIYKQQTGQNLSQTEQKQADKRTELLAQFKAHKRIIILYPMFNYNIPAKLKDYLDNVLVPRDTFCFDKNGKLTGLLNDGRKVLFVQTSGSIFSDNSEFAELEFAYRYLDKMFEKLGFGERCLIRAEGTAVLPKQEVLDKAFGEIDALANQWQPFHASF